VLATSLLTLEDNSPDMLRATFVTEQHLGHYTYSQNLRQFIDGDDEIDVTWLPVTYRYPKSLGHRLPLLPPHISGTLQGRAQIREGLAHGASDVVFYNTQVPAALAGKFRDRHPYVVSTDLTPIQYDQLGSLYGHRPDRRGPLKSYKHYVNKRLFQRAAKLLPWSTWARDSLISDYDVRPDKVEVVPPGVDLDRWTPGWRDREGPLRILFVGGDFYRKGGRLLLEAFSALPTGAAELIVVTRSEIPSERGMIVHRNMQPNSPELIELFRSCDLFVLPTEAEAFGIAAVEASAAGLPVIATAVGGLHDIVVDGETGFLLQPGNVQAMRECLLLLTQDSSRRVRMSHAARNRAARYFDARRNAGRIVTILREAANITGA
jgi:glycosyltransferase involved in cell wall biosynthesis